MADAAVVEKRPAEDEPMVDGAHKKPRILNDGTDVQASSSSEMEAVEPPLKTAEPSLMTAEPSMKSSEPSKKSSESSKKSLQPSNGAERKTTKKTSKSVEKITSTFNYPVFTEEFVYFNKKRDDEVKELQRKKNLLEANNLKLKKQVKELDDVVATITQEVADLEGVNKKLNEYYTSLRTAIVDVTGAEVPPSSDGVATELDAKALSESITKANMTQPGVRDAFKSIADRLRTTITSTLDNAP